MSNTRIITALVAFVATFIFSAGLVRIIFPAPVVKYVYSEQTVRRSSSEIETFLLRDIRNGELREVDRYSENHANAVMDYWKTSSSMDASGFPQDFQNAWRLHMNAWGNYAEYLQTKNESSSSYSCSLEKRYNEDINRTWADVLRIGRNYGSMLR
jgi:hypothetical protein